MEDPYLDSCRATDNRLNRPHNHSLIKAQSLSRLGGLPFTEPPRTRLARVTDGSWGKKLASQLDRRNQLLPAAIRSRLQCTTSGGNSGDEPCDLGFPLMAEKIDRLSSSYCLSRSLTHPLDWEFWQWFYKAKGFLFSHTLESYEPVFMSETGRTATKPHKGNILLLVRVIQYPADSPVKPYFLSPDENINLLRSSNSINKVNCIFCLYRKAEG